MAAGNIAPQIVGGLASLGFLTTLPALIFVSRLQLSRIMSNTTYVSTAMVLLCFALFVSAMYFGVRLDWSDRSKALMMIAWAATVPAFIGAGVLMVAGVSGQAGWLLKMYYIGVGLLDLITLAIPAIVLLVMASPGKP